MIQLSCIIIFPSNIYAYSHNAFKLSCQSIRAHFNHIGSILFPQENLKVHVPLLKITH